MKKIFIDGRAGTTGLRIVSRLEARHDIEIISLPDNLRKDACARREAINSSDIAFLCLPDDAAREAASFVENPDTVIIDASTAHRTEPGWAYGFPELSDAHRELIASSKRIAVPGCHASGFVSLIYPLIASGALPRDSLLCCHSLTGYSGGGNKMISDYEESGRSILLDSPRQYGLTQNHKHLREMKAITGLENAPLFSPIVADYRSGMELTVQLFAKSLKRGTTVNDIADIYRSLFKGPVVSFREASDENGFLAANSLSGSDRMEISVFGNEERIILVSRFDNLGKGASGAAVECMNISLGLEPTTGLEL